MVFFAAATVAFLGILFACCRRHNAPSKRPKACSPQPTPPLSAPPTPTPPIAPAPAPASTLSASYAGFESASGDAGLTLKRLHDEVAEPPAKGPYKVQVLGPRKSAKTSFVSTSVRVLRNLVKDWYPQFFPAVLAGEGTDGVHGPEAGTTVAFARAGGSALGTFALYDLPHVYFPILPHSTREDTRLDDDTRNVFRALFDGVKLGVTIKELRDGLSSQSSSFADPANAADCIILVVDTEQFVNLPTYMEQIRSLAAFLRAECAGRRRWVVVGTKIDLSLSAGHTTAAVRTMLRELCDCVFLVENYRHSAEAGVYCPRRPEVDMAVLEVYNQLKTFLEDQE